jgi:glycosyltransferase involved in cell wall biosynthesis
LAIDDERAAMKIVHVIPSINPEGGGPVEGLRQWGLKAAELGHTVEVVTLDNPGLPFVRAFPLAVHALGPSRGQYRYNKRLVPWLQTNAGRYDAVIVNGLWQYHSLGAWRALRNAGTPYYVFTHGMLDPWFRRQYPLKHLKKWLYWSWGDYRVLRDAGAVLFTSEEERLQARKSFWLYRVNERVISYGTAGPPENRLGAIEAFFARFPELRGRRFLLFLGRIHEKKGCDLLIRAFAEHARSDTDLHLVMAGPDQSGWAASTLRGIAQDLDVTDRITWAGMLRRELKWGAFHSCGAFILPSHQENFGIAVAEALACGKPVLISNKVNIWREIEQDGAGIVADDTQAGTDYLIAGWRALSPDARVRMEHCAAQSYKRRFTIDAMADTLLAVLTEGVPAEAIYKCAVEGRGSR